MHGYAKRLVRMLTGRVEQAAMHTCLWHNSGMHLYRISQHNRGMR
jgi:hypothetical protein